ncbi:insulinase family protein [Nitrospina gracilis]|uniref:insulinase family protein n=1 Tax=Nitrospina gracilis TaxID=35801 RepID=UPI001F1DB1F4|nr:insulinase family protein [Nitrospina gracilis]MCF8720746.1 insulysin [Nitrospina gracilis Nb-211]
MMHRVKILSGILIALFVVLASVPAFSGMDNRVTKTLVLKNNLEVLLMSDPDVDRSAAALSVGVGTLYDPKDKMGLAHYLEHMLFLGTEKYPDVGSFKDFLTAHSGGSNAYTGDNITNYFFEVSHDGFSEALDRFSDFFRAPLFDKTYAEREVQAVNNEFEKNKMQDGWRASHLTNQIAKEGHPVRNFGIGNAETLAGDNRPALLEFHKKYYSARIMRLAVLSKLPLEEQERLVKKLFSDISDHPVTLPEVPPDYRTSLHEQYRLLKIKTIMDIRSLDLDFPTIRLADHKESKPASIVATVMGHEGEGSLLSKLKKEGLALGLSAGGGYTHPNLSSFGISISLTPKGLVEYERVLELVFSYIEMLRKTGFEKYTFDEAQAMAEIDFEWKSPQEGMGFMAGKAALMQDYKLDEVEELPYLYKKYDPAAYRAVLDTLTPENMLVVLKSQNVETDQVEKYFGTEYSLAQVGGKKYDKLVHPPEPEGMTYPDKNDFVPYNLELVEEAPSLVRDDEFAKVWFQYDHKFRQPKVYIRYKIETPHVYDSVENLALSKLYNLAIHEGLNELTYPISLAGLTYSLDIEKPGMVLSVGGYTERINDLLKLVAQNMKTIKISKQKFENIKEAVLREIRNRQLGQAYMRASYFHRHLWQVKQYTEEELFAALEPVTLEDVRTYSKKLYERVYVTGLIHGNWTEEYVKSSVNILLAELSSLPLPEDQRYKEEVAVLRSGEMVRFSKQVQDNNNALYYTLQVGERDMKRQAKLSLIASIVESDFYTQMRTNQQLGYIVWSFENRLEERLFFKMIIQSSNYSPFELQKRVEAWMETTGNLLDGLSDEEFEKHRKSMIVSLQKKGDSISAVANDLYYFATEEDGDFLFKEKLLKVVKELSKEEVVKTGKTLFQNPQIARSIVLVRSSDNTETVPDDVLTTIDQIKNRRATPVSAMPQ